MGKLIKIIGFIVIGAISLVLLLVAAIFLLVDPNDFRDDITVAVQQATGRELNINGELGLSVYPWLGITLGETRLSNAQGFAEKDFARVSEVNVHVKLMPLLQQQLEMKALNLRGLHVNLSRAKDGRTNWDDLLGPANEADVSQAEMAKDPQTTPSSKSATPALGLAIGGINIEDAQLVWDDKQGGQRIEIKPLLLKTGPISLGEPVDIQLRTQISLSEPALQTPIEFDGRLSADLEGQRFVLENMKLGLNVASKLLPVSPMNIGLTGHVNADLGQQRVQIKGLQLHTLGIKTTATVDVQQLQTTPQINGQLSIAEFSVKDLMKMLAIELPPMADANALSRLSAKLDVNATTNAASINNLVVKLDESTLSGGAKVKNFAQPGIGFDLKMDAIDADRYLPPPSEISAAPVTPAAAATEAAQLPLDTLRALDVNGKLQIGKLKAVNAHVTDIVVGLNAKKGLLQLAPLQANLYQGQYSGHVTLDVRKDTPLISADERLENVHVGQLLKDVLGDDKLSGAANIGAKVAATGITPDEITKTLNGSASFNFKDGAVKGINIGQMLREAHAKLNNKPKPPKATNQTDFAALSGSMSIVNGVVKNDDLKAVSPALRVGGNGSVDLPQQRINYLLKTSIVGTDEGQGGKELEELKSITIPIKITGTFSDPKFKLDLFAAMKEKDKAKLDAKKAAAKEKLEEQKAVAKEKLDAKKEKAKQKLEDKLKGLFR